jgi:hypothetical protein
MCYRATRTKLPPIASLIDYRSEETGSLDKSVLDSKLPNKRESSWAYMDLNELAAKAENLKKENSRLKEDLAVLIGTKASPAIDLQARLDEFEKKLNQREKELESISKHFDQMGDPAPTFIEVGTRLDGRPAFDILAASLLVSNQQRVFFKGTEIETQNKQLKSLVVSQKEQIDALRLRLHLHQHIQHKGIGEVTVSTLKRHATPFQLVNCTVTAEREQGVRCKHLVKELQVLIKERKDLTWKARRPLRVVRARRLRSCAAVKIQRVFRGFSVRMMLKDLGNWAVVIQRVFRGFLARKRLQMSNATDSGENGIVGDI